MALQEKAHNINENIVRYLDASTSNMMTIAGHLKDIFENVSIIEKDNYETSLLIKWKQEKKTS